MLKIYLDVCCLNRPFDDQRQMRIRLESEAVLLILARFERSDWQWISSEVVDFEIEQTPDSERRKRVQLLATAANHSTLLTATEIERAQDLETIGFKPYDALHLACAEQAEVDIFLTTDDRLLSLANRFATQISLRVLNPLVWVQEITGS